MKLLRKLALTFAISGCMMFNSCSSISDTDFEVNGVKFKMIAVEGGSFVMRGTSEQGKDATIVDDFLIGETEVTQDLWFAVMGNNPSCFKSDEGNLPVENVSWHDAQAFIKKLNEITKKQFSLPSEIEWEYAAYGGRKSNSQKYAGSNEINNVAWYKDNSNEKSHIVATKKSNELGIYDMSGNIWEWCLSMPANDDDVNSVLRGGSFGNDTTWLIPSVRYPYLKDDKNQYIGFRILLVP